MSLFLMMLSLSGCWHAATGEEKDSALDEAPVLVRTVVVETADLSQGIRATAVLESAHYAALPLRTAGRVVEAPVQVGQVVSAGDLLCLLDAKPLDLALQEAQLSAREASERAGEAALAALEAERLLERSRLEHEEAVGNKVRQQELSARDLVSEGDLEQARYAAERAAIGVQNAELALWKSRLGAEVARTNLAKVELARERAELDMGYARLVAPFDGVITTRNVRVGEQVASGTVIFEIADPTRLRAPVFLPQKNIGQLTAGMTVEVHADALPNEVGHGRVDQLPRAVDPQTGNLRLDVLLAESGNFIPGMFVSLRVVISQRLAVPVVPKKAVRLEGRRALIYRVDGGVAHEVRFVPGLEDTDRVEVTGGALKPGDRVVLVGVEQLSEGAKVEEASVAAEVAD